MWKIVFAVLAALFATTLASPDSTELGIVNVDGESEKKLEIGPLAVEESELKWRRLLKKASSGELSSEDFDEILPGSSWVDGVVRKLLQDKIKGGKDAPEGRFPYMVSLLNRVTGNHKCGGVLIDKNWVLTAAHCVDPERPNAAGQNPIVLAGTISLKDIDGDENEGEKIFVEETIIHPDYTGKTQDGFDIALLRLEKPTKVKTFARLPDADKKYIPRTRFVAIGWGTDGQRLQETLQVTTRLEMITAKKCQTFARRVGTNKSLVILDSMICAFSLFADTCKGDSGGPLLDATAPDGNVLKGDPKFDVVAGITSFGNADCTEGEASPGVYTFVPSFRDWIEATIKEESTISPADENEPNVKDFERAVRIGDLETLNSELDKGVDIEAKLGKFGATALAIAAQEKRLAVVEELIARGANVNSRNDAEKTPLMTGAQIDGNSKILIALLDAGAEIDAQNENGLTALSFAAWNGQKSNVEFLLSQGADETIVTNGGFSPKERVCGCLTHTFQGFCNVSLCELGEDKIRALFD